jgi:hypothetical protein
MADVAAAASRHAASRRPQLPVREVERSREGWSPAEETEHGQCACGTFGPNIPDAAGSRSTANLSARTTARAEHARGAPTH